MEKNKNNFFAKLYCWFYDINTDDLPDNTCTYYFNLWVAIFLFIPQQIWFIPYYIKHGVVSEKTQDRSAYSLVIMSFVGVLGYLMLMVYVNGLSSTFSLLFFCFILYIHIFTDFQKRFKPYAFLKRKFCSKINWK